MISDPNLLQLSRVRIRNFRAIRYLEVPLHSKLTVIIGDNATGKTAVLEAVAAALRPIVADFVSKFRRDAVIGPSDFSIQRNDDLFGEPSRATHLAIEVSASGGELHSEYYIDDQYVDRPSVKSKIDRTLLHQIRELLDSGATAPILAFYKDDRGQVPREGQTIIRHRATGDRRAAYQSAFGGRIVFDDAVRWFEEAEGAELREQREQGPDHRDHRLEAVRRAVERLVPEVSNLRMMGRSPQLAMTLCAEGQAPMTLTARQLSSGFRVMVALAMDLARRMADLNPHLSDPLESPGVVLVDEVDLHLHPRWQQLVISGLLAAFPKVQFIMTTHSPQVLTTLREQNILRLSWINGELGLEQVPSTEGAESGRLLSSAFGVSQRPPAEVSTFVELLTDYMDLMKRGQADSTLANDIFNQMLALSPDDPVLATLDLEKRRRAARRG